MDGLVAVLVGALLCFAGVASVRLAVLLSGFGAGWLVADALGASGGTALVVGLAGAVGVWVVVSLVLRAATFFVGGVTGAVIGAKLYAVLEHDRNLVVALVFTAAVALLAGAVANRWRVRATLWLTALGGAGLLLDGLGGVVGPLSWLRTPADGAQQVVAAVAWAGVALLGWSVQRRVSARALGTEPATS